MEERFTKLFGLSESQNYMNKVSLAAGALLRDNVTNNMIAQLKFKNLSSAKILSIEVDVVPIDASGMICGEHAFYTYADINLDPGMEGGQKLPIYLKGNEITAFRVTILNVKVEEVELPNLEEGPVNHAEPAMGAPSPEPFGYTDQNKMRYTNPESPKKGFNKKLLIPIAAVVVILLIIIAIPKGNKKTDDTKSNSDLTVSAAEEVLGDIGEEAAPAEEASGSSMSPEEIIELLKSTMGDSLDEFHPVYWEDDGDIYLSVYIEGAADSVELMKKGTTGVEESWDNMSDSLVELCNSIYGVLQVFNYDGHAVVEFLNDKDQNEALLIIIDGVKMYDATESSSSSSSKNLSTKPASTSNNSTKTPTSGEKNALSTAHDYLDCMAFSYSGLIDQLEYEGFTTAEATYAVDNCGADWYEQAALMAQEYLDSSSFSRSGLIDQLEYEGFTKDQAEYGVNKVY